MTPQEVGLRPELYELGEDYFYVRKLDDGKSSAPPSDVMIETMEDLVAKGVVPGKVEEAAEGTVEAVEGAVDAVAVAATEAKEAVAPPPTAE